MDPFQDTVVFIGPFGRFLWREVCLLFSLSCVYLSFLSFGNSRSSIAGVGASIGTILQNLYTVPQDPTNFV